MLLLAQVSIINLNEEPKEELLIVYKKKKKKLLEGGGFTIIQEEEKYIEVRSNNTKHQWSIFKKSIDSDKSVILYRKHWETWYVSMAAESIKNHDTYVIENGKIIRWMKRWRKC